MNARQIEVFHAVMKTGSISGAASLLRVSQPAVSQVLLHTEDQLRFPLFQPRQRGCLQETAQARLLHREVEKVYHGLERVRSLADSLRYGAGGAIQVSWQAPGPGHSILPEALRLFRAAYPQIQGHTGPSLLRPDGREDEDPASRSRRRTVPFGGDEPSDRKPSVRIDAGACLLPPNHPLCGIETVQPGDLRGHPLIAFSGASAVGRLDEERSARVGEEPDVAVTVPFGTNTYNLVGAGIGVAIVDGFTAEGAKAFGLQVRPFDSAELLEVVILPEPRKGRPRRR